MAKKTTKKQKNKEEQKAVDNQGGTLTLLAEANRHFDEANAELGTRITHKVYGYDEYDNLYRSHIDSAKWPFNTKLFVPLTFTSIYNKGTRLVTGKVKGRLVATKYGSELGARIGSELLSTQYDEHDHHFEESLIAKTFKIDQNARKYGVAYALVSWRTETKGDGDKYDGPTFEVLDNRKVWTQPGAVSVWDSDYVIVQRSMTLDELKTINDRSMARSSVPQYMNLDKLAGSSTTTMDESREQHPSRNTALRGLSQRREGHGNLRRFRILTEYRRDKWITWTPDVGGNDKDGGAGLLLRVTKNPFKHGLIPVLRLVYIPIDDDIVGMSEIEPGRGLQKASNALVSGFIEAVAAELYPIIKGHPTNVDWETVEFKPRAAWIMNNPQTDLVRMEGAVTFTRNFVEAYNLLISEHAKSMGDTTAEGSQLAQLSGEKTATEIKDLALQRGSRDNLNKIFLASFIEKMYGMWWSMDQQLLTDKKVISVAGKDAIEYFIEEGLDGFTLTDDGYKLIKAVMEESMNEGDPLSFEEAYEILRERGTLDQFSEPMFPVTEGDEKLPKLQMERDGKSGFLSVENNDLTGKFRFSVDLNTIGTLNENQEAQAAQGFMDQLQKLEGALQKDGFKVKWKELLEAVAEKQGVRNPDQFFEKMDEQDMQAQLGPENATGGIPGPQGAPQGAPQTPQDLLGGGLINNAQ